MVREARVEEGVGLGRNRRRSAGFARVSARSFCARTPRAGEGEARVPGTHGYDDSADQDAWAGLGR